MGVAYGHKLSFSHKVVVDLFLYYCYACFSCYSGIVEAIKRAFHIISSVTNPVLTLFIIQDLSWPLRREISSTKTFNTFFISGPIAPWISIISGVKELPAQQPRVLKSFYWLHPWWGYAKRFLTCAPPPAIFRSQSSVSSPERSNFYSAALF